jgi:YHS domain-containing protein
LVALTLLALAGLGCATLGAGSTAAPEYLNCPVSGGQMRVGPETPRSTHGGKTYYFCCAGCKEAFDKDPGHYSRP